MQPVESFVQSEHQYCRIYKVEKFKCIFIVPSCSEQRTGSADASFSDDVTGADFLFTCQVTEVLLQCIMFPFSNVWTTYSVLLVSGSHQWNVEAGETGNCSDVRAPSPIRSTVRCGSFYVMTSLRDSVGSILLVRRRRSRSLQNLPYKLSYITRWSRYKNVSVVNKPTLFDVCGKCFNTWEQRAMIWGEICMNDLLKEVRIILK